MAARVDWQVYERLSEEAAHPHANDYGAASDAERRLVFDTLDTTGSKRAERPFAQRTRPRSQQILRAIESLCSALDVTIVAEGVETEEEQAYLRERTSIRLAQGYFFGRPQFIDALNPAN